MSTYSCYPGAKHPSGKCKPPTHHIVPPPPPAATTTTTAVVDHQPVHSGTLAVTGADVVAGAGVGVALILAGTCVWLASKVRRHG